MFFATSEGINHQLSTMAAAISAGVLIIILSKRLNTPAIVLLLVGGFLLGPSVFGIVQPEALGEGLGVIVSMSVGLILFEGGMTLDLGGYRSAPMMIKRLLSMGVLITWLGTALAIYLIARVELATAIISASLVIVTGPTVIAPLLKRIGINERLHSVLHWEGVLIDPIGVFIAVLCFEWLGQGSGQAAFVNLAIRVGAGLSIGLVGGWLITVAIRRRIVPEEMINSFALGAAILIFGVTEAISSEAGLLAVTVAGFVFGVSGSSKLKQVKQFKAELTDLLIGTLFILLAARLEPEQFQTFGVTGIAIVAIVMLVVRPLNIFACSFGLGFSGREKVFLSWVAPRGIVAASLASLFALRLEQPGAEDPRFIETFTYSVIIATIVLQGFSAGPLARWLKLKRQAPRGWLIVGAHPFARRLARFIRDNAKLPVVLVDSNARLVREAQLARLPAITGDARDAALYERPELQGVGNLAALTDNEDLNVRLCQIWSERLGPEHVFRCGPVAASDLVDDAADVEPPPGHLLWPTLPKPSILSAELAQGVSRFRKTHGPVAKNWVAIAAVKDGEFTMAPGKIETADSDQGEAPIVLAIKRRGDSLSRALHENLVLTIEAESLEELITAAVDAVVATNPAVPRQETIKDLVDRETVFPTLIGQGVAVPHAYCRAMDNRLCAIIRVPGGMAYHANADQPVELVFLLLSPTGDTEGHLATLADIARRMIDPQTREALLDAKDGAAALRVVRESR